ncbi:multidrug transporter, partial [Acetobacter tropicalis]
QVVTVDAQNKAHYKNITVGRMSDAYTEVDAGLTPTDHIINNPPADLLEGQTVRLSVPEKGYLASSSDSEEEDDE